MAAKKSASAPPSPYGVNGGSRAAVFAVREMPQPLYVFVTIDNLTANVASATAARSRIQ
jgi:hypothetical protein